MDFYKSLKPLQVLLKFTALAPYSLNNMRYVCSRRDLIINDITAALLITISLISTYSLSISSFKENEGAKKTVQLMEDLEKAVGKSNFGYKQIELFSLQVYVEDFKFSVFGCFPLDWTLLHSMAAGIATYLVIFHQFSNMEKNL
ncbi:hypothetical protein FQA39_LY07658 [Lamprigera yunnana]|nr:hypothetical protein FQA39_LY07658 [Lamprigera yunnana]